MYPTLQVGNECSLRIWRGILNFFFQVVANSDTRLQTVRIVWLLVWCKIDKDMPYFTDSCLRFFGGHRFHYIVDKTQLLAVSCMPFSSNSLRCALCTLPFHIISWHFHPSTGNAYNFVLTHKSRSSRFLFLQLWIHRPFENALNMRQELFLFLSEMDTLHSLETENSSKNFYGNFTK